MTEQPNDLNAVKTCIKCGIEKPLTAYSFAKQTGKYINTCKACRAEYAKSRYKERAEDIKAER